MFLHEGPAETTNYMILGFVFIFVPMAIHVWSLISRRKNLELDLQELEGLDNFEQNFDD